MIPRPELGRGAVDVAVLDTAPLVGGNEGWQSIRTIIVGDDDVVVVVVVPGQANDSVEDVGDAVAAAGGGGGFGSHGPWIF